MYPNNGYFTDVDTPNWTDARYLPTKAVLPRWIHVVGVLALCACCIWAGYGLGIITPPPQHEIAYTHHEGWAKVVQIVDRARADHNYTAAKATADTAAVWQIQQSTDWISNSSPMQSNVIRNLRDLAANHLVQSELAPPWIAKFGPLNSGQRAYLQNQALMQVANDFDSTHNLLATTDWHETRRVCGLMYVLALPFMLIILLSRGLVASRTMAEAIGIWRTSWRELVAATVFWPIGVAAYRPDCQVLYQAINSLAAARGSQREYLPIWNAERPTCPVWLQAEADTLRCVLPGRELLLAIWHTAITPPPEQSYPRRHLRLAGQLLQASYATAALCIILPLGRLCAADGSVLLTDTLDDKNQPSLTFNLGNAKVGRLWVYGANLRAPTLEGSLRFGTAHIGAVSSTWGPYARFNLRDHTLTHVGGAGFYSTPLWGGTVMGPWYLGHTPQKGGGGLFAPNNRALWNVTPAVKLGIGWAINLAHGAKPDFLVGPYAQFKLGPDGTQLRLRWADDPRHFDGRSAALMCELYSPF